MNETSTVSTKSPGDDVAKHAPIDRRSLPTEVATRLRERIISGEIKAGEQLRQDEIASWFHVSRIPVREALRQLEAEGLVTIVANRGAVVTSMSPEEIQELFDLRSTIEVAMLARAIPRLTQEDIQRAEDTCDVFDHAMATRGDVAVWGTLNWEFHSALYKAADSPLFLSTIKSFHNNADRYIRLHLFLSPEVERYQKEHRAILELCRRKEISAACEALAQHITSVGRELARILRHQQEPV